MKRISYGLWVLLAVSGAAQADIGDNLSYLVQRYGIAYFAPIFYFDLNTAASVLRTAMKPVWYAKSLVGGQSFEDLQNDYLYPPQGAIPDTVLKKLQQFNTVQVASSEVPEFNPTHPLRKDTNLGSLEEGFVKNRLVHAARLFQASEAGQFFVAPDTNPQRNPKPYGYALDIPLKEGADVPRIATCFSGGGFRAMIATLGFWQAVSDMGIVDSILYSANLSGSTWCTIPWCVGASLENLRTTYQKYGRVKVGVQTLADLRTYIEPAMRESGGIGYVRAKFMSAFLWSQPLSSVRGLYGPMLGQMTLASWDDKDLRAQYKTEMPYQSSQYLYFWQAMDYIEDGTKRPFPIATALIPYTGNFNEKSTKVAQRQKSANGIWMEFNPESVGFEYFNYDKNLTGVWIPSFALGRIFTPVYESSSRWYRIFTSKKVLGYSSTPAPAHTLDYWEGTWGSAFTVSPADIYRIMFADVPPTDDETIAKLNSSGSLSERLSGLLGTAVGGVATIGKKVGALSNLNNVRLFPAIFNNFACFEDSPIQDSTFTAVDAGIDFNLPFPPLLRQSRAVDLIIVGDWSKSTPLEPAAELKKAENWAQVRGVPFPAIKNSKYYKTVYDRPMTLFNEYPEGQTGPAILYIPLIDNAYNISNFDFDTCFKNACTTFNFDYALNGRDSVKDLADEIYNIIWDVYPQIREVVQQLVIAKNEGTAFTMTMADVRQPITV